MNIVFDSDMKRISQKCIICGKEMLPCGLKRKYCSDKCKRHNKQTSVIQTKPVMQFTLEGKYIKTFKSVFDTQKHNDGYGYFERNCVARCARGERRRYRNYIWIYQNEYTEELLNERVNKLKKKVEVKPEKATTSRTIYQYEDDILIHKYNSFKEVVDNGYIKSCISKCLTGKQKTHLGYTFTY